MKYLLSIVLLSCFSYGARAQAVALQVRNNSGCWAYYFVMGGPGCGISVYSNMLAIAPGTTVTYSSPAAVPGFPAGVPNIVGAGLNNKSVSCSGYAVARVGEACTGMNPSSTPYLVSDPNTCAPCGNVTATWIPGSAGGGMARLIIN